MLCESKVRIWLLFFISSSGRKYCYNDTTPITQDNRLTAGAWAVCARVVLQDTFGKLACNVYCN